MLRYKCVLLQQRVIERRWIFVLISRCRNYPRGSAISWALSQARQSAPLHRQVFICLCARWIRTNSAKTRLRYACSQEQVKIARSIGLWRVQYGCGLPYIGIYQMSVLMPSSYLLIIHMLLSLCQCIRRKPSSNRKTTSSGRWQSPRMCQSGQQ